MPQPPRAGLTERETEIMCHLARSHERANIHRQGYPLYDENTVRSHVRNIYAKPRLHTPTVSWSHIDLRGRTGEALVPNSWKYRC